MFKIAVCDDDRLICADIEQLILNFQETITMKIEIEIFYDGESLCKYIERENSFDLIFLDIEMKKLNGIQVGRIIREIMDDYETKIVYISAKNHYDRELFDVQPMHFLPKPLVADKVIEDVKLAIRLADKRRGSFTYKKGFEKYSIPIKDILYFESLNREIRMVHIKGEETFYDSIENVLKRVGQYQFLQIHRSYVVNYVHISRFKYDAVIMTNNDLLPIGQSRRKEIRQIQLSLEKDN
ncbi:LytTR family DNA-binding domain-containing protein [Niameybacter massiliensis]|uniref:Stage 0 sporulation protein A homolog n=1 Tax=Holtiella tumoricola TaxID=3018743 RepID=A0AA42J295_9FIRM|nr:LytTR family DNA-binding domain-containing protein [Holtiella tumoricola]MDA3732963.1 LytTR family DNA-binding domain-containing protein [Holtiella tumoricola]